MELREILSHVDHTLLAQDAAWDDIRTVCDDGIRYRTASVCIPASYVARAAAYAAGRVPICTVIGFPCGYSTTAAKCFEASDAAANGASEIDMVISVGRVKDGDYAFVLEEIRAVRAACAGKLLKVIIETCLLTDDEKIRLCHVVSESGAEYIKTSTGFSTSGATPHDVELLVRNVAPHVMVKAAGGIRSLADAEQYLALGASRLGTSTVVRLVKNMTPDGAY